MLSENDFDTCTNGVDDDRDGFTDCADFSFTFTRPPRVLVLTAVGISVLTRVAAFAMPMVLSRPTEAPAMTITLVYGVPYVDELMTPSCGSPAVQR